MKWTVLRSKNGMKILFPLGCVTVVSKCWYTYLTWLLQQELKGFYWTCSDSWCIPENIPLNQSRQPNHPWMIKVHDEGFSSLVCLILCSVFSSSSGIELKLKHVFSLTLLKDMEPQNSAWFNNLDIFLSFRLILCMHTNQCKISKHEMIYSSEL